MSNISKELVQKSEEIITDYVYFSTIEPTFNGEAIHFDAGRLQNLVHQSYEIEGPFTTLGDAFIYTDSDVGPSNIDAIYIPLICYGAGNTINFEITFDHPLNAGNQTVVTTNWVGANKYYTNHVIYTDEVGFLDEINIKAPITAPTFTEEFPKVSISLYDNYFLIPGFKVYKQPNEIFALNYQLAFLPLSGRENIDFIGSEFINNNCFVKKYEENTKTRYIAFMGAKSSNLDTKANPYLVKKAVIDVASTADLTHDRFQIAFTFETLTEADKNTGTFKSWAIIDDKDNILFASNNTAAIQNDSEVVLYFTPKANR